jgi:hypothetical protein
MSRPTDEQTAERKADAEDLVLSGWTSSGALELAKRHDVRPITVEGWRRPALARIHARGPKARPDPSQRVANIEEALERNKVLQEQAGRAGKWSVVRMLEQDRLGLLGLLAPIDIRVTGTVEHSLSPVQLLERRRAALDRLKVVRDVEPVALLIDDNTKH